MSDWSAAAVQRMKSPARPHANLAWVLLLALAGAIVFVWVQLLTSNLFVFTEARDMIGWHQWPGVSG